MLIGLQQEPARAAGRIANRLAGLRIDHFDNGIDQGARREILPGAGFDLGGIALQEAFIDCAFDVDFEAEPGFVVNQLDEALQARRVLDRILGLEEDRAEQPIRPAERGERLPAAELDRHADDVLGALLERQELLRRETPRQRRAREQDDAMCETAQQLMDARPDLRANDLDEILAERFRCSAREAGRARQFRVVFPRRRRR